MITLSLLGATNNFTKGVKSIMSKVKSEIEFDYSRLFDRIYEKYGSCSQFSRVVGKTRQTISYVLTNGKPLMTDFVLRCAEALDIDADRIAFYFFKTVEKTPKDAE